MPDKHEATGMKRPRYSPRLKEGLVVPSGWSGGRRPDSSELAKHREVVANCPAVGDATVVEAVQKRDLAVVLAGLEVESEEWTAAPVAAAIAVLDDEVAFRDDLQRRPAGVTESWCG